MKRCKSCGGLNEDDSRRCQYCDTRFPLIGAEICEPGFDSNPSKSEQNHDASTDDEEEDEDDESEETPKTFGSWILGMLPIILSNAFFISHMTGPAFRQILTAILILIVIISFVAFVSQNKK